MHKTILIEEITIENVTEKINEKLQEMEKDGYQIFLPLYFPLSEFVNLYGKI